MHGAKEAVLLDNDSLKRWVLLFLRNEHVQYGKKTSKCDKTFEANHVYP